MSGHRHLLLLGTSRQDDSTIHQSIRRLGDLGHVIVLTEIRHLPSDDGDGRMFFNALASMETDLAEAKLIPELKRIEGDLGRASAETADVAIDLDLLASFHHGGWRRNPHAIAKGEFQRATVGKLATEAMIIL